MDIISVLGDFFLWLGSLQGWVLIPIFLFIFGVVAGVGIKRSLRGAVLVGIGLLGLMTVVISIFAPNIMPVVGEFGQAIGKPLEIADAGVFTLLTVVWGSAIAVFFIPVGFLVNIAMIAGHLTDTLDADLLNYWVWGITGVVIWILTGSMFWGVVGFVINEIIILKIADFTAHRVQKNFNMPGVSIPHGNAALWPPIGVPMEWVYNHIPGLRGWKLNPESFRKRFGILGEPWFIGLVIGLILGIVVWWPVEKILTLMIALAGVMVLFPRMVGVMMEGLVPLAEGIREWGKKVFKREIHVGLDAAVLIGFPEVITVGIILIPIVLGLALVLPGNHVLPLADLAIATPFLVCICMAYHRGNILRGVITGTIIFAVALYICGDLAPVFTEAGAMGGLEIEGTWTSVGAGSNWITWILAKIANLFGFI